MKGIIISLMWMVIIFSGIRNVSAQDDKAERRKALLQIHKERRMLHHDRRDHHDRREFQKERHRMHMQMREMRERRHRKDR